MKILRLGLLSACLASLFGCGDGADAPQATGAGNSGRPLFAIESLVFGMNEGDSSTSYVLLLDSLDDQAQVTLDNGPRVSPVTRRSMRSLANCTPAAGKSQKSLLSRSRTT